MKIADLVKNFVVIYLVDITEVPEFNAMYELFDPCTTMFFFRNKHMMIDLGTGNNNKVNWPLTDKDEMIAIMETIYRGASRVAASSCLRSIIPPETSSKALLFYDTLFVFFVGYTSFLNVLPV